MRVRLQLAISHFPYTTGQSVSTYVRKACETYTNVIPTPFAGGALTATTLPRCARLSNKSVEAKVHQPSPTGRPTTPKKAVDLYYIDLYRAGCPHSSGRGQPHQSQGHITRNQKARLYCVDRMRWGGGSAISVQTIRRDETPRSHDGLSDAQR